MGVTYREELMKAKKRKKSVASVESVPRSETEERTALRKEYFRVAHARHHSIYKTPAAARRLKLWREDQVSG